MNSKVKCFLTGVIVLCFLPVSSYSHDMWVVLQGAVKKGAPAVMKMASDHAFPAQDNEFVSANEAVPGYIIGPAGKKISIKGKNDTFVSSGKLKKNGTYLVVTGKKWMYWTKTAEGYQKGKNKKQVTGAVKSVYSGKYSKALITVGKAAGNAYRKTAGQKLEIIPLKDPSKLKRNSTLPVKILFKGKPFSGEVKATYAGYSKEKNAFAVETKTDKKGICSLKLVQKGPWLIKVGFSESAANKTLCDEVMYSSTLTFELK